MNVALAASEPLPRYQPLPAGRGAAVTIFQDLAAAEPLWRRLAAGDAVATPYADPAWIRLWHRHVSGPAGQQPLIAVGLDMSGAPLFVWPLVTGRLGPMTIASFFGGKHATLNMPLWRRDAAERFSAGDMRNVLSQIAAQCPQLDLLLLHNQPESWHGVRNPFAALPHQRASEDNFVLNFAPSGQDAECQVSRTVSSRLRNKERKLARLPGYRYLRAQVPEDVGRQLDAFFGQKATKLAAMGVDNVFAERGVEDFIRAACLEGLERGQPVIELHALECEGDMLALFSGIHDGKRFTSMFNSHTASPHARHSPGLILLQHLIADCARRGFTSFDVGPGEARYKTFFCKELEPIFDSVLPLSRRGRMAAPALRLLLRAKSAIKRSPGLWRVAHAVRARLPGRSA